ncbi:relaxase/mobilization nuclease domain-containing protein [Roseburia hominis]
MSVCSVIPCYYLEAAIRYSLDGDGHNGKSDRVLACTGVGMKNSNPWSQMYIGQMRGDLMKNGRDNKAGKAIQCYRYLQSFSRRELDPNNLDDVMTAHEAGVQLAKSMFPGYKVLVVTQADGSGSTYQKYGDDYGCLHNHITVVNARASDGKCLRGKQTTWLCKDGFRDTSDKIVKQLIGNRFDPGKDTEVPSSSTTLRAMCKRNETLIENGEAPKYIVMEDLLQRVLDSKNSSVSWDDFKARLQTNGVHIKDLLPDGHLNPKHKYVTFVLDDLTAYHAAGGKKKSVSMRGSKKDPSLERNELIAYFRKKELDQRQAALEIKFPFCQSSPEEDNPDYDEYENL